MADNPNGVAPSSATSATTPLGLKTAAPPTQGSSCLATLGWWTQSRWDCQNSGFAAFDFQKGIRSTEKITHPPPRFCRCDRCHSFARKCFRAASRKERNRPRVGSALASEWPASSRAKNSCVRSCAACRSKSCRRTNTKSGYQYARQSWSSASPLALPARKTTLQRVVQKRPGRLGSCAEAVRCSVSLLMEPATPASAVPSRDCESSQTSTSAEPVLDCGGKPPQRTQRTRRIGKAK